MRTRGPIFYSGIPPGDAGTGRLVGWLQQQGARVIHSRQYEELPRAYLRRGEWAKGIRVILTVTPWRILFRMRLWLARQRGGRDLVLIHPQSIGMRRVNRFIARRPQRTWLFLLDSSYFCIRSYNHLPGEDAPCLRCIGGDLSAIATHGCRTSHGDDAYAPQFVRTLRQQVQAGEVSLLTQCTTQAQLAERHFNRSPLSVVGLWTSDWESLTAPRPDPDPQQEAARWEVVYHGYWVEAKGAHWALEVARHAPHLRFLFPMAPPEGPEPLPPNCHFETLSWYTGLEQAVSAAAVVLVPSLWSAPIEGAVIKSIGAARAVGVVENATAFAQELPRGLTLTLPTDPREAAQALATAVLQRWRPDPALKAQWVTTFRQRNEPLLRHICDALDRAGDAPSTESSTHAEERETHPS